MKYARSITAAFHIRYVFGLASPSQNGTEHINRVVNTVRLCETAV